MTLYTINNMTSHHLFKDGLIFKSCNQLPIHIKSSINYGTRDLQECSKGIQAMGKIHPAQGNWKV